VTRHIAAFLARGSDVVFCVTSGAPLDGPARAGCLALQELGVTCRGQDGAAAEAVIKDLAAARVEVVYLHRLAAAAAYAGLVRHHLPQAFLIYAIADLHALRLERQAAVTNRPDLRIKAKAVRGAEIWAMQAADCVLTHSRAEAAALREAGPRINVRVVPWHVEATPPAPLKNRADIAFIGGAGHAPNFDAVTHLATDIMPLVWRSVPTMRVLVAGAGWPPQVFAGFDQRIVGIGHQPSLLGLLNEVRLTVAPLRFGAGIKGKVLTSLAAGTPCVMTTTAAEGLPLNPVLGAAVGDGERLADNILAVYKSKKLQRELATAGQDMIKDYFSRAHVVAALAAALGRPIPTVAATSWPKVAALPEAELVM
jgi:glycosyltransferase involved in cell wall biosynthesis